MNESQGMKFGNNILNLKPSDIRFTQDSIAKNFKNGNPCPRLFHDVINGAIDIVDIPKIRVAEKNGKFYSANNRRLYVFRALEYEGIISEVAVTKCNWRDIDRGHEVTTNNDGDYVKVRGLNGEKCLPHGITKIKAIQRKREQEQARIREEEAQKRRLQEEQRRLQEEQRRLQEEQRRKRQEENDTQRIIEQLRKQAEMESQIAAQRQQERREERRRIKAVEQQRFILHQETEAHFTVPGREQYNRNERQSERKINWWKWIAGTCAAVGLIYWISGKSGTQRVATTESVISAVDLAITNRKGLWDKLFANIIFSDV